MIVRIVKGRGFAGAVSYLFHGRKGATEDKKARRIGGNMAGQTPSELAREFGMFKGLRPRLTRAVAHISLSLAPEDRTLTDEEFNACALKLLDGLGFSGCPSVFVRHNDTAHQHAHILASRIRPDGSVVSESNDFQRAEKTARTLEAELGLRAVEPSRVVKARRLATSTREENAMTHAETRRPVVNAFGRSFAPVKPRAVSAPDVEKPSATAATEGEKQGRELRRCLAGADYEQSIRGLFGGRVRQVRRAHPVRIIELQGGGRVTDEGDKLVPEGLSPEEAAEVIIRIAQDRKWKGIRLTGSREFLLAAMRNALSAGIEVIPLDDYQRGLLLQVQAEGHGGNKRQHAPPFFQATPKPGEERDDDPAADSQVKPATPSPWRRSWRR